MTKSRLPCSSCGSSDALTDYGDHVHCFSCGLHKYKNEKDLNLDTEIEETPTKESAPTPQTGSRQPTPVSTNYQDMTDRGISRKTAEKYRVGKAEDDFYSWQYPMYRGTTHVANKFRRAGDIKGFSVDGEFNKSELFGQHLFPENSAKAITVTEGYDDAMAAYEMTGSKYPCVSVHSASTAAKDCADNYEYLNSFSEIVVCFDTDEPKTKPDGSLWYPGQEAAQKVAQLFPPKKVKILTLSRAKDANDYLKAGLSKEFVKEWWDAPVWTPDGIKFGTSLWDDIKNKKEVESINYPFDGLNELTYGLRLSEFVVITADTGVGKTSVLKEIEHYLLNHTKYSIGIMHLEETNADTGLGIMSIEACKPLHLPDVRETVSEEELRKYYDKTVNTDRVIIYDHFGSNDIADLLSKIRHMAALGAKYIVLDHLSIVVSDQNGDERKQLDEIATKIKTLTMELSICVLAVIHQNRQGQIRGTAGVEQLANIVIKLSRDKEAEDPWRRNVTKVVVQKNRFCGRTGPACYLFYDNESGRLSELEKSDIIRYESGESVTQNPFGPGDW